MKVLFSLFFFSLSPVLAQETARNPVPVDEARESFKLAAERATSVDMISVPEGFEVELVRSANTEEGSWISLVFDDQNHIYVGKEDQGVLRFTMDSNGQLINSSLINDDIEQCRGLLWAHNSLYLNSNPYVDPSSQTPPPKEIKPNSHGLFRLQDLDGDGQFETRTKLLETSQEMPGHGRNQLRLGPDGLIYFMSGYDVYLTDKIDKKSFLKNFAEDQLIPNPWDNEWFNRHAKAPGGHLIRMDKDGKFFQLVAGGFRNPMDIDFNRNGEIFTYDADMEWDAALAWYRPTRILHLVSGGDYGWRRATAKWPFYYEDSLPAVLDIGLGSPTGVEFGYKSSFPGKWREAFFAGDWTYGRIIAVHLEEKGSSYIGTSETFASGRPMNVVDLTFGPDGHLYFVTGGMKTKSGLYRIRWVGGDAVEDSAVVAKQGENDQEESAATKLRNLRYQLEVFQVLQSERGASLALENIGHPDDFVRHAARIALENQEPALWMDQALASDSPAAMVALARTGVLKKGQLLARMIQLDYTSMTEKQLLGHLRALQLEFIRSGAPLSDLAGELITRLAPIFPNKSTPVNHELCVILVYLEAPQVLGQLISLIRDGETTEDLSHYLVNARYVKNGWSLESKRGYLKGVQRLETFQGGKFHQRVVDYLRNEIIAQLTETEKMALAKWIVPIPVDVAFLDVGERTIVKDWQLEDFDKSLSNPLTGRNYENGLKAYTKGNCVICHLMQGNGASQKGILGPDLTNVGGRFGLRDLLVSIIDPSLAINDKYRNPAAPNLSSMPTGQLNFLTEDEVLDLLAYLQSGGNREDSVFRGEPRASQPPPTVNQSETNPLEPKDDGAAVPIAPSFFEKLSASNESDRERIFRKMKEILEIHPSATFQVVGHADDTAYEKTNFDIGLNRAKYTAQNLIFRGIPKTAVSFRSEGDKMPSDGGNRRIEIIVNTSGN